MSVRLAEYLLRFDDLCPTMDRARWARFLPMIRRFRLCPILAIVPENADPDLDRSEPDPTFWEQMRQLESSGATIGLHGYRHRCETHGRSLIPIHDWTEFAGAPGASQQEWIRAGLAALRAEGLQPRIWVAPRHGFDAVTLRVLRAAGIDAISDGFATEPFFQDEVTWIPQQLWEPVAKPSGVWTICLHSNTATDEQLRALESFVEQHAGQFTSVERILVEWPERPRSIADRLFHARLLMRIGTSRLRRRLRVKFEVS